MNVVNFIMLFSVFGHMVGYPTMYGLIFQGHFEQIEEVIHIGVDVVDR